MRKLERELLNGLQVQKCGVNNACLRIRGCITMNRGLPADSESGSRYGERCNYKLEICSRKGGIQRGYGGVARTEDRR